MGELAKEPVKTYFLVLGHRGRGLTGSLDGVQTESQPQRTNERQRRQD